jgi:glutamate decarboxylase
MLHIVKPGRAGEADDVYASAALGKAPPKDRIPEREIYPFEAYQLVHDELGLDGNARLNLATFCQTWVEPQVHDLMNECIDKNIIDKDEYPQTAELEARCVHILADLWHAPEAGNALGTSTTGSSEAAMLGGLALKWRWRRRMQAAGERTGRPNLVCGPVQICWHKFARYFEVEMRQVPMDRDRLLISPGEVVKRCDENTIAVIPTLGVTYTLQYEPVEAIARALDGLQQRSGLDVPMHIDAASGGFLAPFLTPELPWDFRIARVRSINASGHKFGLSPLGCGWIVWRTLADLPEDLIFRVNYLGGELPTFALNFSRPGGQVIAQYYNFTRLGREGYTRIQKRCAETAAWLSDQIASLGPFSVVHDGGRDGIPGCTWKLREDAGVPYNLFDLADKVRSCGWLVPAYSLPANATSIVVQRVLVKNGFSRDMAGLFLRDLQRAMARLAKNPPGRSLTEQETGSFKHT